MLQIKQKDCQLHSHYLIQNQHLKISNFLNEDFAKRLSNCLENEVDWGLACRINGEPKSFLNTADIQNLEQPTLEKLQSQLSEEFQFVYNTYMMVTAYIEKRDPEHFLNQVLEWLNYPDTLDYFKRLIKNPHLKKINAQATRYLPGHFLTQHNDEHKEEGRLYAYVLGISKDWNPDWGGLLHILNKQGEITKTIIPEYNSLSIFKVPQNHFVSHVSPLAKNQRLGITGWLLSK